MHGLESSGPVPKIVRATVPVLRLTVPNRRTGVVLIAPHAAGHGVAEGYSGVISKAAS